MLDIDPIRSELERSGFFHSPAYFADNLGDLSGMLLTLSNQLGTPVKGRFVEPVEVLVPQNEHEAHRNSLSNKYGKNELPFHIDMAHQQVPSRYLAFACALAEGTVAPTLLLDFSDLELTADDLRAFETGVFLIKNGRRSFYANIKGPGTPYLRWDPGCMYPQDSIATKISKKLLRLSDSTAIKTVNWHTGSLLVVDNWRMLHARGKVSETHGARTILRATIQ